MFQYPQAQKYCRGQKLLIPPSPEMPQGAKYVNTLKPKNTLWGKVLQYPRDQKYHWVQNVSISPSPKETQGEKCVNTPKLYTTCVAP